MARPIDYKAAEALLSSAFADAEADFAAGTSPTIPSKVVAATGVLFASKTQAHREVLIGCALARMLDEQIDISLPYVNQGDAAYNGRTLAVDVVNPFLHAHQVPASKNPFLNVYRRGATFTAAYRNNARDKNGFDSLLVHIDYLRHADKSAARSYLRFLSRAFVLCVMNPISRSRTCSDLASISMKP